MVNFSNIFPAIFIHIFIRSGIKLHPIPPTIYIIFKIIFFIHLTQGSSSISHRINIIIIKMSILNRCITRHFAIRLIEKLLLLLLLLQQLLLFIQRINQNIIVLKLVQTLTLFLFIVYILIILFGIFIIAVTIIILAIRTISAFSEQIISTPDFHISVHILLLRLTRIVIRIIMIIHHRKLVTMHGSLGNFLVIRLLLILIIIIYIIIHIIILM